MSYKNTGAPNGRPTKADRNKQIIADFKSGMPIDAIAKKHGLKLPYTRTIAQQDDRKERLKKEAEDRVITGLYAERDMHLKNFYASLNTRGALSAYQLHNFRR